MTPFEFTKHSVQIPKQQGLECKSAPLHFGKNPNGKTNTTMSVLGENYPKTIYGMPHFEFAMQIVNSKEMGGLIAKLPAPQN